MKSNNSLSKSIYFWLGLFIPIIIALFVGYQMFDSSIIKFDLTYHGISNFIYFFKIPLSIAALSFPLVALFATIHRSSQSAHQIQLTIEQNNFSNYYKHREEFFKILDNLEKEISIEFQNKNEFYKKLFPKSSISNQNFIPSNNFKNELINDYIHLCNFLDKYDGEIYKFVEFFKEIAIYSENPYYFKAVDGFRLIDKLELNKNKDYLIACENTNLLWHLDIIYILLDNIFYFANIDNSIKKVKLGNSKFEEHYFLFKIDNEKKELFLDLDY